MAERSAKLEGLKKKQAHIKAQIQAVEAAEKTRDRKRETRRRLLVGAYYLDKATSEGRMDEITHAMAGYLTRRSDRALFDLSHVVGDENDTQGGV